MEKRKCKNKKCQRSIPEGYKHKYCENCRNERVEGMKDVGKAALGLASVVIAIVTGSKISRKQ